MDCPRCKSPLIVVEYHDIELDWCPSCEGLWFDSGEMELVAAQMTGSPARPFPSKKADTREERLKCPECNRKMEKRLLGDAQPVVADMCRICGGLWLDRGELEQIMRGNAAASDSPVFAHLRGTFSHPGGRHATTPDESAGGARK